MTRLRQFRNNVTASLATLFRYPRSEGPRPAWPARSRLAMGAAAAILSVVLGMMLVDVWSIRRVRSLPPWAVAFFSFATDFGLSGWFLWPTGLMLVALALVYRPSAPLCVRGVLSAVAVRLGFLFAAIAVPGLFVAIVKRLIGRARPFIEGSDTWAYLPFAWRPDYASFPSGHATSAFAAAVAIGALWPKARPVMWIYAVLIALSRVAVGAHHPSDVIAGAIVGSLGALLVRNWFARRRLGFVVGPDGLVHKLPGPSWRRIKAVARKLLSA
jgi:membrane-associated phospholipid phosphatase